MDHSTIVKFLGDGIGLIVVPWCIFVTVSLFNQRQEVALLKQIVVDVKAWIEKASAN